MKLTKYILLIIGLLGIAASVIRIVQNDPLSDVLMGLISSSALIYGYFVFGKLEKQKEK